jgi:hypothetical protein
VVDQLGRPLAGALVMATQDWSGPVATTGSDGGFTLPVLPPGRTVLFAVGSSASSAPIVIEGGFFPGRLRLVVGENASLI